MTGPLYSVVIPWRNRTEIRETLVRNRPLFECHSLETVIVNGGGDQAMLDDLVRRAEVPDVRVVELPGTAFNRSLCCNLGVLAARGVHVFLLDADIVVSSDPLTDAAELLADGGRFAAIRTIFESAAPPDAGAESGADASFIAEMIVERTLVTVDGRRAVMRSRKAGATRVGDGLVVVRRTDFHAAGGLNARLVGWGYEDTDFQLRLQFLLGLERVDVGEAIHLTHPTPQRSRESWHRNMTQCFRNYARREYRGSLDEDARAWEHVLDGAASAVGTG